jgi:predicted RNA binding protein YcfA (HicA-like mRNA interferase family)
VAFADALARFRMVGWREVGQSGSHRYLDHPKRPRIRLNSPDHRNQDLDPATLGKAVELAGLTAEQFLGLTGSGHRRYARQIRREVYCMDE